MLSRIVSKILNRSINVGKHRVTKPLFESRKGQRCGFFQREFMNLPELLWDLMELNPDLQIAVIAARKRSYEFGDEMIAQKAGKSIKNVQNIAAKDLNKAPDWYKRILGKLNNLVDLERFNVIGMRDALENKQFCESGIQTRVHILQHIMSTALSHKGDALLVINDADQLFGIRQDSEAEVTEDYFEAMKALSKSWEGYTLVNSEHIADRLGFLMAKQLVFS